MRSNSILIRLKNKYTNICIFSPAATTKKWKVNACFSMSMKLFPYTSIHMCTYLSFKLKLKTKLMKFDIILTLTDKENLGENEVALISLYSSIFVAVVVAIF